MAEVSVLMGEISGQITIIHWPELLGHFGMIPLINHDSSEGEQRGRYNVSQKYQLHVHSMHLWPYDPATMGMILQLVGYQFNEVFWAKNKIWGV